MKLNIGASGTYIPHFVNVDISPGKSNVVCNLEEGLPFQKNTFDLVFTDHTIEHVRDFMFIMNEIFRVMRHEALLLMGVPYYSWARNQANPFHYNHFNEHTFEFFGRLASSGGRHFTPIAKFQQIDCRIHYASPYDKMTEAEQGIARRKYLNVAHSIDFAVIAIKGVPLNIPPKQWAWSQMKQCRTMCRS